MTPAPQTSPLPGSKGWTISRSLPTQDLTGEPILAGLPRTTVDGQVVPVLGGIPILARLAVGGMGTIYYGLHPNLLIEVAVKVLTPQVAQQYPETVERLFREARLAAKIRSPHLVAVLDVAEAAHLYYIVMEYVAGYSAAQYLGQAQDAGRKGLEERKALEICVAGAAGLAALHENGIIHRDLKPDNILLPLAGKEPRCLEGKLADLGLARWESDARALTAAATYLGTPGYMAPEQAQDAQKVHAPADVFGMGATLYELLAGAAPFGGSTAWSILNATIKNPHVPVQYHQPETSAATAALLDRCLAKRPEDRYPDGGALVQALRGCLAGLEARSSGAIPTPTLAAPTAQLPAQPPAAPEPSRDEEKSVTADLRADHRHARYILSEINTACNALEAATQHPAAEPLAVLQRALAYLQHDLLIHMRRENDVLFPALLEAIPWGSPMAEMFQQHEDIVHALRDYAQAVAAYQTGGSAQDLARKGRLVAELLRDDFLQEEEVLFAAADRALTGERATRLRLTMGSLVKVSTRHTSGLT